MTSYLAVLHEINKAGKEAKKTIQDIDKAITDLSIATNMSREATAGLVKEYNSYAKELKSTTLSVTSAADDYLRAGKTMSETKKLIEDSVMLSKLQTYGLTTAQTGLTVATTSLGNAFKGMLAYMAANPILVFTMVISSLTMTYQSYNQKLEETRQKNIEASESAIDHANSLKDLYNEYSRLHNSQS